VCSAIQSVKHSHRCEHDDTTAALITVPPTLLAIADEVIE
jgi:hypothetical protein